MKKLLLFAMSTMVAMTVAAQEEDVTHYIQNAGFDDDLTFQADGSKKAVINQVELSDRSIAGITADSTLYALVNKKTPKSRTDGRTFEAINGFKGRIKGWTLETNGAFPQCEWTYFGSISYDLGPTTVPVADDGTTYLTVPARPTEFDGGAGFVYLRAGWTNRAIYKQVVKLPCAVYRLEYWTINTNSNTTATAKDLTQITCRKDVFKDEAGTGLSSQVWTKHEFEFTPTAEFTMQFGYEAANAGSGGQPIVALDGIKLYKIGDADKDEINTAELNDAMSKVSELTGQAAALGYTRLSSYLNDYEMEIEDMLSLEGDDLEAAALAVDKRITLIEQALNEAENVDNILIKIDNILRETNYPGKNELQTAYEKILSYKEGTPQEGEDVVAEILGAIEESNEAIKAYYVSQQETATVDNPADFTVFVSAPWFIKDQFAPTLQDNTLVFPNFDAYTDGSNHEDFVSTNWTNSGYVSGGDQRTNFKFGYPCWNAWANNIEGVIGIKQELEGLPNGYYTLSANMVTESGYRTDQHIFLASTSDKQIQEMKTESWEESTWETVTLPAEKKVLVVDGKLTIGAEGTGTGSASAGWFCVTNFKLNFVGKASDDDIDAAVKKSFDDKVTEVKNFAESMHLGGDKKALNDSITKYEGATTKEAYLEAITALNAALTEANNSENKYLSYLPLDESVIEGKTLRIVAITLAETDTEQYPAYGEAKPIAEFAYNNVMSWINSADATYTDFDDKINALKSYVDTYVPVYKEAAAEAAKSKESGKKTLEDIMAQQKAQLTNELQLPGEVNNLVNQLKEVLSNVEKQNIFEDDNANDYTAYIVNPNAEAESGWTFTKGNGNTNSTSGQWFDGSGTRYFDSYNSEGLNGYKASQLIENLPNGTYNVGVYTRTPAEGAYIFAGTNDKDTTFVEIPLTYYNNGDGDVIASDHHGAIWEQARVKFEVDRINETDPNYEYYYNIYNANNGEGRGWGHQEIQNIEVTDHKLFIGTMSGTEASGTAKVFAGNWYSVGGWTLTLIAKGDNEDWGGPIAGIQDVENTIEAAEGIYTISGAKVNKLQRGLNIVVRNGKATKILVK